jgi:hypothetical protein
MHLIPTGTFEPLLPTTWNGPPARDSGLRIPGHTTSALPTSAATLRAVLRAGGGATGAAPPRAAVGAVLRPQQNGVQATPLGGKAVSMPPLMAVGNGPRTPCKLGFAAVAGARAANPAGQFAAAWCGGGSFVNCMGSRQRAATGPQETRGLSCACEGHGARSASSLSGLFACAKSGGPSPGRAAGGYSARWPRRLASAGAAITPSS